MIFIFRDPRDIPPERLLELENLARQLNDLKDPEARRNFIQRHSKAWGKIKEALLEMSQGKCWYSEARDVISDWQIDHFRPKAKYDWLAFDWTNYRIAGCLPNRRKHHDFPLTEGSPYATLQNPDLDQELYLLLDPTKPDDPSLLTFDEKGQPRTADLIDPKAQQRVEISIQIFDLNSVRLREARQQVWRECRERIQRLREAINESQYLQHAFISDEALIRGQEVRKMTSPSAQFSSTARACVKAHEIEWVYQLPKPRERAA